MADIWIIITQGMTVLLEIYVLGHIRRKRDILKYYTYLQNLFALLTSILFIGATVFCDVLPEFIRGLRYIATCGLLAAMFVFIVFLGAGKKAQMSAEDFLPGCTPKAANSILHYICPLLSLFSFAFLERDLPLESGIWTILAPIPSCGYWMVYLLLSLTKAWEEPYDFSSKDGKNKVVEFFSFLLIPLSFILISFLLWQLK